MYSCYINVSIIRKQKFISSSLLHSNISDDTDSHETVFENSGIEIPLSSSPGKFHLRPDADGSFGSPMKRTPSWFEYKEVSFT